jgi:hypothetical protein
MKVPRSPLLARLLLLAMLGMPAHVALAQEQNKLDIVRQVKAAYLFKFGNYVQWPRNTFTDETSPIVIGVVGADKIAEEVALIAASRSIGKHPVRVKRIQHGETPAGIHMLFVGKDVPQPVTNWLTPLQGQPVLCVTEEEGNPPPGSAINFVLDNNRVQFDVSLPAVQRNNLELSALLLSAAREVQKDYFE